MVVKRLRRRNFEVVDVPIIGRGEWSLRVSLSIDVAGPYVCMSGGSGLA